MYSSSKRELVVRLKYKYSPGRFYPRGDKDIVFLKEAVDPFEKLEVEKLDLELDILDIRRLHDRNQDLKGYLLRPLTGSHRVNPSHLHVGIPSPTYEDCYGLPGIELYVGSSDVIAISFYQSSFYEFVEDTVGNSV